MIKVDRFSQRLREYRSKNNLSFADMEKMTGVPAQTLNRYERDQRIPKIDMANLIAQKLNINALWLQGFDVPMYEEKPAANIDDELNELLKIPEVRCLVKMLSLLDEDGRKLARAHLDILLKTKARRDKGGK